MDLLQYPSYPHLFLLFEIIIFLILFFLLSYNFLSFSSLLQTQDLRVGQANESCIRLTQENSIENSVQKCLPYILNNDGLCYYFSSLF